MLILQNLRITGDYGKYLICEYARMCRGPSAPQCSPVLQVSLHTLGLTESPEPYFGADFFPARRAETHIDGRASAGSADNGRM